MYSVAGGASNGQHGRRVTCLVVCMPPTPPRAAAFVFLVQGGCVACSWRYVHACNVMYTVCPHPCQGFAVRDLNGFGRVSTMYYFNIRL